MATFLPLIEAPMEVQIHVSAAVIALVLAPVQIFARRRGAWHRRFGYIWVLAMLVAALSSFWITDIRLVGPYSPIHLLSLLTLVGLWNGMRAALRRDFVAHAATMRGLAFWALGIAGAFTLMPGRIMHQVLLAEVGLAPVTAIILGLLAFVLGLARMGGRGFADKMQNR